MKFQTYDNDVDVIVLCGGKGKRFTDMTNQLIPKSLFAVNGKHLIEYSNDIMNYRDVGQIILAVDYMDDYVIEWAKQRIKRPYVISKQKESGIFYALKEASRCVKNKYCMICNSDEIRCNFNVEEFVEEFKRDDTKALMLCSESMNLKQYRSIEKDKNNIIVNTRLKDIHIDDSQIGIINCGVIILPTQFMHYINNAYGTGWGSLIDSLVRMRLLKCMVSQVTYFNIGTKEELNRYLKWKEKNFDISIVSESQNFESSENSQY